MTTATQTPAPFRPFTASRARQIAQNDKVTGVYAGHKFTGIVNRVYDDGSATISFDTPIPAPALPAFVLGARRPLIHAALMYISADGTLSERRTVSTSV